MQNRAAKRYNILLIRSSSIGDVILATACLQHLEKINFPASVFWLGRSPALDLIQRSYPEVACIQMKSGMIENFSLVRALPKIDLVIDLQINLRSIFVSLCTLILMGSRVFWCRKRGFARSLLVAKARLRPRKIPRQREDNIPQYELMLSCLKRGLESLSGDVGGREEVYPVLLSDPGSLPQDLRQQLMKGKWIAVAPGAAHPAKQAPEYVFEGILNQVVEQHDCAVVFLGEEKDKSIADNISKNLPGQQRHLNLCGDLSLWQSINVLSYCRSLVGNDTSLCHAAQALNVPSAVLFGPTVEEFGFAAWGPTSRSFSSPLGCRPCSKHGKIPCRFKDYLCFSGIERQSISEFLCSHLG
ncbi:MAG: glycosyltransferase family 9 protein [Oligoflexales bacterium]